MNRIVLIGNGFDLAHGLKTSYNHFIEHLWKREIGKLRESLTKFNTTLDNEKFEYRCDFFTLEAKHHFEKPLNPSPSASLADSLMHEMKHNLDILNIEILKEITFKKDSFKSNLFEFQSEISKHKSFKIVNNFLFAILSDFAKNGWSDFEAFYYAELNNTIDPKKLNVEFDKIKTEFENYLAQEITPQLTNKVLSEDILEMIYEKYKSSEFNKKGKNSISSTLKLENNITIKSEEDLLIRNTIDNLSTHDGTTLRYPSQIFMINFNYTEVDKYYYQNRPENYKKSDNQVFRIPIHGTINDINNPIIFGYGDEHCPEYSSFEHRPNDYLENFKSFKYLQTNRYNELLDALESDCFQVHIYGHSCGLADRSLLSIIFNHINCCSIKIFYREKKDGTDNFLNIAQGISKSFKDKNKFRELVVNKTLCKPFSITRKKEYETEAAE